jgi:hypothetical protein
LEGVANGDINCHGAALKALHGDIHRALSVADGHLHLGRKTALTQQTRQGVAKVVVSFGYQGLFAAQEVVPENVCHPSALGTLYRLCAW